jgi:methionine-rich copper-binding protein CopC
MNRALILATLAVLLLTTRTVDAHAVLDRAVPPVGSTVHSAPRSITLWFSQKLEGAFSAIEVRDAGGARVDVGKAQVDSTGTSLRVGLKALPPGPYQVHWRVLSVDTHTTEGNFSFSVGQ